MKSETRRILSLKSRLGLFCSFDVNQLNDRSLGQKRFFELRSKLDRGFTIVELLIVIVIIGILATITIVAYNGITDSAQDARRSSDIDQIKKVLMRYDIDHGGVPRVSQYANTYAATHAGWDSSDNPDWLSFLRSNYGAMPTDPLNRLVDSSNPSLSGNRVYRYYCYWPGGTGSLVVDTPTVVLAYRDSADNDIKSVFEVSACL